MANPDLKNLTHAYALSAQCMPTTSEQTLIGPVPTSHAYVVNTVQVTNVTASTACGITLLRRGGPGSPTVDTRLAYSRTVSGKTSVNVLLGKEIYMDEGDELICTATAASVLEVDASYTDYTDA